MHLFRPGTEVQDYYYFFFYVEPNLFIFVDNTIIQVSVYWPIYTWINDNG